MSNILSHEYLYFSEGKTIMNNFSIFVEIDFDS